MTEIVRVEDSSVIENVFSLSPIILFIIAIIVTVICFIKYNGSAASKGLFASGVLGIILVLTHTIIRIDSWQLIIPIIAFTALSLTTKENK